MGKIWEDDVTHKLTLDHSGSDWVGVASPFGPCAGSPLWQTEHTAIERDADQSFSRSRRDSKKAIKLRQHPVLSPRATRSCVPVVNRNRLSHSSIPSTFCAR